VQQRDHRRDRREPERGEEGLSALYQAFTNGLSHSDAGFVHGTSLATACAAFRSGILPTGRARGNEGYIYVNPLPSRVPWTASHAEVPTSDAEAVQNAAGYAAIQESYSRVLRLLSITDPTAAEVRALCALPFGFELTEDDFGADAIAPLRQRGLTFRALDRINRSLGKGGGVVLALSRSVMHEFTVEEAEGTDDGLRIAAPEGIPARCIVGVEPCSDEAFEFLGRLREIAERFGGAG